jgi:hypothetical protein
MHWEGSFEPTNPLQGGIQRCSPRQGILESEALDVMVPMVIYWPRPSKLTPSYGFSLLNSWFFWFTMASRKLP